MTTRVHPAHRASFPRARLVARHVHGVLAIAGAALLGTAVSVPAHAQEAADEGELQEVLVTGSRIVRRDYAAASPIVTVNSERLNEQAGGTFGIKLQQMPQVTPGGNEMVGSGQPTGRATIDLRGLGPNRTLVLANGQRLQPSTGEVVVDLNSIPAALIDNVEIITGGASAVYGSDAIAGVVNLILKDDFEGIEVSGKYNITDRGDAEETMVDILGGSNFADGRGNVVFALGYLDRGPAYFVKRGFYTSAFALGAAPWGSDLLPQGNFVPDPLNLPDQSTVDAVFASYGIAAGTVAAGSVLSFNPDGTLFGQAGAVNYRGPQDNFYVVSPLSGAVAFNLGNFQVMTAPTERYTAFSRGSYEFTDSLKGFAQASFTKYKAVTNYGAGLQTQGTTAVVPADNPFIPADLKTLLDSRPDPTAPFSMRKLWTATGTSVTTYDNTVYQFTLGLEGKFGETGWTWDVSGSHGRTDISTRQESGGASFSRIQALLTSRSVTGPNGELIHVPAYIPASNGSGTYVPNPAYATATNDGGRSLPGLLNGPPPCPEGLDLFGFTPLSDSCKEFLQIHPTSITEIEQNIVEANVQGGLFDLPAGELRMAAGVSYRENKFVSEPSPANSDLVGSFGTLPVAGSTDVEEIYLEALVPVLRGMPLVRSLDLGLGYRYSDYLSGGVNTYKAELDWRMVDSLRFRGGYQRAIRAPNVIEMYNPARSSAQLLGNADPCNFDSAERTGAYAAQMRALCLAQGVPASIIDSYKSTFAGSMGVQQGNPNLKPEKADTVTFGMVWNPVFDSPLLQRFSAAVDYYQIELEDAISTLGVSVVFARCYSAEYNPSFTASNEYCAAIERNPANGAPDRTHTPYYNLGGLRTSGVDLQLDWGFGLGAVGLRDEYGSLAINLVATRLLEFDVRTTQESPWVSYVGTYGYNALNNNGARPDWKASTNITWTRGSVDAGVRWYYVDEMRDIVGGPGLDNYSRFDLYGGWTINEQLRISAGITNVLDKDPLATFGGIPGNTDSGTYDTLGRRYYVGFNMKF
jgi:iron complex outermembrane receptor protein